MTVVERVEPGCVQVGDDVTLFVSSGADPHAVSGAIVRNVDEGRTVTLRSVGAGAANQAVKSVAIARQVFASKARADVAICPGFEMVTIHGEERTALTMKVVPVG